MVCKIFEFTLGIHSIQLNISYKYCREPYWELQLFYFLSFFPQSSESLFLTETKQICSRKSWYISILILQIESKTRLVEVRTNISLWCMQDLGMHQHKFSIELV